MTYYKTDNDNRDYRDLLNGLDCQCGAFQRLWMLLLNCQGVNSEHVEVISDVDNEKFFVYNWDENELNIDGITVKDYYYPYVIVPLKYESEYYFLNGIYYL